MVSAYEKERLYEVGETFIRGLHDENCLIHMKAFNIIRNSTL